MISLCVPSRGRPDMLLRLFRSAAANTNSKFEVCCWQDEDDRHAHSYPKRARIKYGRGPRPVDDLGVLRMSELWTKAASISSGDILGLIGDDSVIETPGWAEKIEAAFESVPDRIVMVYPDDGTGRQWPETLFVHRKWFETIGEFTPAGYPGWFSDVWIWTVAAELERAIFLPDVSMKHLQGRTRDATFHDGHEARKRMGGGDILERLFWSEPEKDKRDKQISQLRDQMDSEVQVPLIDSQISWVNFAPDPYRPRTLVSVHCYSGDKNQVEDQLPYHQRHGHGVMVMSPEDSPVEINVPGVRCVTGGLREYVGFKGIARQLIHMRRLLEEPYDWFLMNDSDSLCIAKDIPAYLYEDDNVLWSNVVHDACIRPEHIASQYPGSYPHIAFQPPVFASRSVMERLVSINPTKDMNPSLPVIDWMLMVHAIDLGIPYKAFPTAEGYPGSFGAYEHTHEGKHVDGAALMVKAVEAGNIMLHSIKHPEVLAEVSRAHERFRKNEGK
jgi:hypothetical protein